jgi:hypothetical protein
LQVMTLLLLQGKLYMLREAPNTLFVIPAKAGIQFL